MNLRFALTDASAHGFKILVLCSLFLVFGCAAPRYADRGAAVGGLTGAGIGAAIGHANDSTLAGTLLGGTVGAVSGALVGDALDEIDDRNQRMIDDRLGRRIRGTTTHDDIVAMSQAGLSNEVIIQHLKSHGFAGELSADTLVTLKRQGVDDQVIRTMQDLHGSRVAVSGTPYYSRPVVVEEHYYGPPHHPPRRWRRPPYCRPGFGWSVAWQN